MRTLITIMVLLSCIAAMAWYRSSPGTRVIKVGREIYTDARFDLTTAGLGVENAKGWWPIKNPMLLPKEDIFMFLPMDFTDAKGRFHKCCQVSRIGFYEVEFTSVGAMHARSFKLGVMDLPKRMRDGFGLFDNPYTVKW